MGPAIGNALLGIIRANRSGTPVHRGEVARCLPARNLTMSVRFRITDHSPIPVTWLFVEIAVRGHWSRSPW